MDSKFFLRLGDPPGRPYVRTALLLGAMLALMGGFFLPQVVNAQTQAIDTGTPTQAALRYHTYPAFTRLVIQSKEKVIATPSLEYLSGGQRYERLTLTLSRPLEFPQGRFPLLVNDGVIRQVRLVEDNRLTLELGRHFADYRMFGLDDPSRLVVDLHRRTIGAEQPAILLPTPGRSLPAEAAGVGIVLDPAHGGEDSGRRSAFGTVEKALVLDLARDLQKALANLGQRAILTRQGDYDLPVRERVALANVSGARLWIGLHAGGTNGIRVYEWVPLPSVDPWETSPWDRQQSARRRESARLALTLRSSLASMGPVLLYRTPLRDLSGVAAPAVVVEFGFAEDAGSGLLEARTRRRWVEALAQGIQHYLGEEGNP